MNLKELINNGENKRVEFKEQLPKNDSIGCDGRITRKEAKSILDLGKTKIKELIKKQLIEYVGGGRSTYYVN